MREVLKPRGVVDTPLDLWREFMVAFRTSVVPHLRGGQATRTRDTREFNASLFGAVVIPVVWRIWEQGSSPEARICRRLVVQVVVGASFVTIRVLPELAVAESLEIDSHEVDVVHELLEKHANATCFGPHPALISIYAPLSNPVRRLLTVVCPHVDEHAAGQDVDYQAKGHKSEDQPPRELALHRASVVASHGSMNVKIYYKSNSIEF